LGAVEKGVLGASRAPVSFTVRAVSQPKKIFFSCGPYNFPDPRVVYFGTTSFRLTWEDLLMNKLFTYAAICAVSATAVFADGHGGWTSVADESSVAFGSIKKNVAGEVHHFEDVSGTVNGEGAVEIKIDLASVETYIDIRNERMGRHVFGNAAMATLSGEVDMDEVTALAVGETTLTDFEGVLALGSVTADIEAEMLVARLGENRVLVTTSDFIMLSTADLGIDGGIDKLKELAKLSGITRVTPVSIRMVFEK
jgi:polyisoprenoid-binding protein YceI